MLKRDDEKQNSLDSVRVLALVLKRASLSP